MAEAHVGVERLQITDLIVADKPEVDDPLVTYLTYPTKTAGRPMFLARFARGVFSKNPAHLYSGADAASTQQLRDVHTAVYHHVTGKSAVDHIMGDLQYAASHFASFPEYNESQLAARTQAIQDEHLKVLAAVALRRAARLSRVAIDHELYVAATSEEDSTRRPADKRIYVAKFAGFSVVRSEVAVGIEPIVQDGAGETGLLPAGMYIFNGLYVPVPDNLMQTVPLDLR